MTTPQLFHVDAFTTRPFRGNPAGVVLHADTLTEARMQDIARELKHSETAFVLNPVGSDHDVRIRYFTPTTEVPICGHATIAAHYARAKWLDLDDCVIRQKTGAGIQAITIRRERDDYRITMRQGPISFGEPIVDALRERIASALELTIDDLVASLPVQVVSTGHSKVMVPLRDGVDLDGLAPDNEMLTELSRLIGCNGYFPYLIRSGEEATDGRMFAPAIGIAEDPVTGNANGPLGAYLVKYGLMRHDGHRLSFAGHQGRAIRRDGIVHVTVDIDAGQPKQVSIQGDAVLLFTAALSI
ncbi:PhzF family isomerase [Burkholderia aenigmatica]|uniref:PhzF family isomerase n=1 Tax=Burkholderia cepacia complex TaxID=87882 RepID=UPI001589BBCB|nr:MULTISPECIES: PhzF family isomerase [Burkholderia cepacia complex]UKD16771.1 PhzF family isomerase [Burkholderia aenigmatica]